MLENFSWDFFTKTGSIEAFLEYKKIKDLKSNDNGNYHNGYDNKGNQSG